MENQYLPLDTAVSFDPYAGEPGRDGDQRFTVNPDGTVFFRLKAPGAKTVEIDQFGARTSLSRVSDDMWEVDSPFTVSMSFEIFFS